MMIRVLILCVCVIKCVEARNLGFAEKIESILDELQKRDDKPDVGSQNARAVDEALDEAAVQSDLTQSRKERLLEQLFERDEAPSVKTEEGRSLEEIVESEEKPTEKELVDLLGIREEKGTGVSKTEEEFRILQRDVESHTDYICIKAGKPIKQTVENACVYAHNHLRKLHGAKPLKWDKDLAAASQKHADYLAKIQKLEHTDAKGYGENLACRSINFNDIVYGPATMILAWYYEILKYNFKAPKAEAAVMHFTQVVWAGTTSVGCGLSTATNNGEQTFLVCQYQPAGNVGGQYPANVKEPAKIAAGSEKDSDPNGGCDFYAKCPKYTAAGYCNVMKTTCIESCKTP